MKSIQNLFERFFSPTRPLPAGTYHYQAPPDAPLHYRLHLRLEPDGHGLLIVNASTILHLNQTAAEYAYHLIQQTPEEELVRLMQQRYNADASQIQKDFRDLQARLEELIATPDLDPVTFLDFERQDPYSEEFSAPLRLDCALTYQIVGKETSEVVPLERVERELLTEEWKAILKKTWEAGIPHIIFTGGEPTLRPDLPELIAYADELGQVTGVLTDGLRLAENDYRLKLLQSGLDHIMIILDPKEDQAWEALRDVLAEDIFTTVHLTITAKIAAEIDSLLERLAKMGARSLSLSIETASLKKELEAARLTAAEREIDLTWDLPVPYSQLNPVALELEESGLQSRAEGTAWLYVEPDGDVLPAQGVNRALGNLLSESWEAIWKKR